ncbi:MAG: hypothetical protein B7Z22_09010, partial [Hyphomonas sp. 32-62-5]
DVTDREGWAKAADEAEAIFGNVHVLALNAGVGIAGPMATSTYRDWDFNIQVNIYGIVNGLVTFLPRMQAHGEECHIVATSSTGGFSAVGTAGLYCTAKFAVSGMVEALATELEGTPIGVSCFYPGPVQTNLGATTGEVRPSHLQNEPNPDAGPDGRPPRNFTFRTAGQEDEAFCFLKEIFLVKPRNAVISLEVSSRRQEHEALIARFILRIGREPERFRLGRTIRHIEAARHDRLNAVVCQLER